MSSIASPSESDGSGRAETPHEEQSSRTVVAGLALLLAAMGAVALTIGSTIGFLTPATESLFTLLTLAGWTLLVWAALLGGAAAVGVIRTVARAGRAPAAAPVLVIVTAVVITAVVVSQPLFGASGASA